MAEKPILFNGEMVRAILAGTKTVTRRAIKPQPPLDEHGDLACGRILGPEMYHPAVIGKDGEMEPGEAVYGAYDDNGEWGVKCPYGRPGDLLWLREAFALDSMYDDCPPSQAECEHVKFLADGTEHIDGHCVYEGDFEVDFGRNRPSIHMPRWASRITLRVTAVRVERVQEIKGADVLSEGVSSHVHPSAEYFESAQRDAFAKLWNSINKKRDYGWDSNPWCWCVSFEVVE